MRYTVEVDKNNGDTYWYKEGTRQIHRVGGPSIEFSNGDKMYHENDVLHRLDGPAVEQTNGVKMYYIHGKKYTEKEYNKEIEKLSNTQNVHKPQISKDKKSNKDNKTMRYTVEVKENGDTLWYKEGTDILHRIGDPAIVDHDGFEVYCFDGNIHNLDGPAVNGCSGPEWWVNGCQIDVISNEEFNKFLERFYKSSLDKDIKIENKTYRLVEVFEDSK